MEPSTPPTAVAQPGSNGLIISDAPETPSRPITSAHSPEHPSPLSSHDPDPPQSPVPININGHPVSEHQLGQSSEHVKSPSASRFTEVGLQNGSFASEPETPPPSSESHHHRSDSKPLPGVGAGRPFTPDLSRSSTTSSSVTASSLASSVLVISSLESISNSKDAKRSPELKDAAIKALQHLRGVPPAPPPSTFDPNTIFEPLRLACETRNAPLMISSLDCIGKLVSYSFFADPAELSAASLPPMMSSKDDDEGGGGGGEPSTMAERVATTVCDCFQEASPDNVQLQIIKAILALILSSTITVHQSSLLRAVRTVYNIFLLSKSSMIQTVAQGTLTQVVGHVFGRVELGIFVPTAGGSTEASSLPTSSSQVNLQKSQLHSSSSIAVTSVTQQENEHVRSSSSSTRVNGQEQDQASNEANGGEQAEEGSSVTPVANGNEGLAREEPAPEDRVKASIKHFEERKSFEGASEADQSVAATASLRDYYIKDAFLVFRALCKLSMKPLGADSEKDVKSHGMRSKLLSLQLISTILQSHLSLFTDPSVLILSASSYERTPFIQAIKQYLCLSLSRNATSPVQAVFEASCDIFSLVVSGMRTKLKKEIGVLLNEIFIPILEMRNSTLQQKHTLLVTMRRICQDPQTLVDMYLNYDCDRTTLDNIYERLVNVVSKVGSQNYGPSALAQKEDKEAADHAASSIEDQVRRQSLETLVSVLRSLVLWAGRGVGVSPAAASSSSAPPEESSGSTPAPARSSEDVPRASEAVELPTSSSLASLEGADDPSRFGDAKQRKTTLLEGIKKFNFKPTRGIEFLIQTGFIKDRQPFSIAHFLLHADGLNKAAIGEYLGEGDADTIATMHAFVDMMDFSGMAFVDALRAFLQSFRLPGEAQKIDRFMLKFAERYLTGNPDAFATADAAYVLAFSVIMLNTDAHNPGVKNRMSKTEFIKNNRGINDGQDLPEESLTSIYDDIYANEIRMKDEVESAIGAPQSSTGLANALATVGRDLQKEAYVLQSSGMANKTEALFKTMVRAQRRGNLRDSDQFFIASHFEHVRPMFQVVWTPLLAGISAPLQYSDDMDLINLSLDGFKQAIKVVCLFELELERNAFVTTLAKFTFLNNLGEMKPKNVEAIRTLLDVAMVDGNYLKGSWREVLTCVSQLERFQLISRGVDMQSVPELGRKPSKASQQNKSRFSRPTDEVTRETSSTQITIAADMIFSSSKNLTGTAIVDFVQALSDVSTEEIQSSGLTEHPRVFSLQKLVEISYYNMERIRIEWSNIWAVLGEHFNQVCCHANPSVSFLALDSLRQLAMRFLEKEELPHFKFQKDFLRPFEYAITHNNNTEARDMVLQCLQQMVAARVHNLKSGWRTMFGVFSAAASKVPVERIATQAFGIVQRIDRDHFTAIVINGAFADMCVCVTDFCKISRFQKISLQAIEMLKGLIPHMLSCSECRLQKKEDQDSQAADDIAIRFWFPVLFAFYDIIMNGEDLEVRKRALDYLFDTLKKHGHSFPQTLWDAVCKEVLFPIFAVLRSRSDVSRFSTHEDMSVWLSTTMIQALRNLVDLFSYYFDVLGRLLDQVLSLLCECILQENDTLARIGTSCLQQLLEKNVDKLTPAHWERIVSTFIHLYRTTTAYQLFDENLRSPKSPGSTEGPDPAAGGFVFPLPLSPAPATSVGNSESSLPSSPKENGVGDRRRTFRQIIVKCVLQLLLIETTHELLQNGRVYSMIPPAELLQLMSALEDSYRFAKRFNGDKELRMALWKVGFMKQLPNLLKQESSSAATLVSVLLRMYTDNRPNHVAKRAETVAAFVPLSLDIVSAFVALDAEAQTRNIAAWTPVVAEVLQGFCSFDDATFAEHLPALYPIAVGVMSRDLSSEVRESLRSVFFRAGNQFFQT